MHMRFIERYTKGSQSKQNGSGPCSYPYRGPSGRGDTGRERGGSGLELYLRGCAGRDDRSLASSGLELYLLRRGDALRLSGLELYLLLLGREVELSES